MEIHPFIIHVNLGGVLKIFPIREVLSFDSCGRISISSGSLIVKYSSSMTSSGLGFGTFLRQILLDFITASLFGTSIK